MKPCSEPGCPALTKHGGPCDAHRKRRWHQHQEKTAARGYGPAHRRWRKVVLARDPLCIDCLAGGLQTPATDADHIDGDTFNRQIDNGRGLCRKCHNRRTHGREGRVCSDCQGHGYTYGRSLDDKVQCETCNAQKTETPWEFE